MARRILPWTNAETETFLCILGEEEVQRELDGAVRNERVFQLVSEKMVAAGHPKTTEQCRTKSKKLRAEYRKVKDHNNRSGVSRKTWRWYDTMDAIYGHRPASRGREGGIDTATSLLESLLEPNGEARCSQDQSTLFDSEPMATPECTTPTRCPPPLHGHQRQHQWSLLPQAVGTPLHGLLSLTKGEGAMRLLRQ